MNVKRLLSGKPCPHCSGHGQSFGRKAGLILKRHRLKSRVPLSGITGGTFTVSYLSMVENGKRPVTMDVVKAYALALA